MKSQHSSPLRKIKVLLSVSCLTALTLAPTSAALLYDLEFQNSGGGQTLSNTGTLGGAASSATTNPSYVGAFTSDTPGPASNSWAYSLPSNGIVGAYLTLPDSTDQLRLTSASDAMTVALWVKLDLDPQRVDGLVGNLSNAGGNTGWSFWLDSTTNKLQFTINGANRTYSGTTTVAANTWTHVAVVYSGLIPSFYINGQFVGAASSVFPSAATTNNEAIRVGMQLPSSYPIDGMRDEVKLFNTALTAQEIASLAAVPEPGTLALLAGGGLFALLRRRLH